MTKTLESIAQYSFPTKSVDMTPVVTEFLIEVRLNLNIKALTAARYVSSGTNMLQSVRKWEQESLAWQDDLDSLNDTWPTY